MLVGDYVEDYEVMVPFQMLSKRKGTGPITASVTSTGSPKPIDSSSVGPYSHKRHTSSTKSVISDSAISSFASCLACSIGSMT